MNKSKAQKKYNICAIGNALVDQQFSVPDNVISELGLTLDQMTLASTDETEQILTYLKKKDFVSKTASGGSAVNSLVAASNFGLNCIHLFRVSNDSNGQIFIRSLNESGIDVLPQALSNSDVNTGTCVVLVTPDSKRTMSTCLGISSHISENYINKDVIKDSEFLYLEGYMVTSPDNFSTLLTCNDIALEYNIKRVLSLSDPGVVDFFTDQFKQLLKHKMDIIFCNEAEAKALTNKTSLSDIHSELLHFTNTYIITLGDKGSICFDGSDIIQTPAIHVKAIDTNGAGDIFAGAFLSKFIKGNSFKDAALFASQAAAILVQHFGPRLEPHQYKQLLTTV